MGIDHIFVDECQVFKNAMFQTRHTRVAGIGNTQGSQRAMNLMVAIRDIQNRTGKGFRGYISFRHGYSKCLNRTLCSFQIFETAGTPTAKN